MDKIFEGTREDWLNKIADFIYDKISLEFVPVVPREQIRLSIGFMPKGNGKAIGVCHYESSSQGGFREIFIKPTLGASNLAECIETAQVVAHEVTHAVLPADAKHGPKFSRVIKNYLGAEGKPTAAGSSTVAVRCTGAEACIGSSDRSVAQGWGLIFRVSFAQYKKIGDNFRCPACGSSTVVELPERLRADYQ